mmetsp:Transcript_4825/g.11191  ORF Transcript_4825/g.11191 Transcript_4825/m.11191 type:complete len:208 (-) Transcript_4825:138-761(-)
MTPPQRYVYKYASGQQNASNASWKQPPVRDIVILIKRRRIGWVTGNARSKHNIHARICVKIYPSTDSKPPSMADCSQGPLSHPKTFTNEYKFIGKNAITHKCHGTCISCPMLSRTASRIGPRTKALKLFKAASFAKLRSLHIGSLGTSTSSALKLSIGVKLLGVKPARVGESPANKSSTCCSTIGRSACKVHLAARTSKLAICPSIN